MLGNERLNLGRREIIPSNDDSHDYATLALARRESA
jgi:hypothetical protein